MGDEPTHHRSRRQFVKGASLFAVFLPSIVTPASLRPAQSKQPTQAHVVGGGCDGCGGIYEGLPASLSWETRIAPPSEPGEPLEVSGVIYRADGRTPAPGVILYVYHTDAGGHYSPAPDQTGTARRHGHLRGWMRTNPRGEYRFRSIRPAPYPNRDIPAHIHPIIKEPDKNEYYLDEYWFDDDPLITADKRAKMEKRGGLGIIHLSKNDKGVWVGRRDIVLGLNIPDYR
ncbi:MAG TPA: intradiol ring-cleavage dioxygenase [Blastocatellia bacterium]|nr:intradiol ring-cleavage dioxygenase [Blastocatellia bacterium]